MTDLKTIPIVYKIYLRKMNQYSDEQNRVITDRVRKVLTWYFRIPHQRVSSVLHEMYELGLIDLANHRYIWIKNRGILLEDLA